MQARASQGSSFSGRAGRPEHWTFSCRTYDMITTPLQMQMREWKALHILGGPEDRSTQEDRSDIHGAVDEWEN